MKKYSLLMGLMCAALSITSCSKDNTETFDKPKGYEFELYAAPQTRTEVDGLDMKWSADDAMNVFHAPTGTTNYSSNDQFTVSDIEGGVFKGTITDTEFDPNGTYDWYVLYPYKSQKTTPALDEAYFGIGSYATSVQTQKGINNQDHICGVDIPLYGKVTNTTGSPSLQMHHIATLFRINVINTGSADLNVTSITLTSASENLIGTYYLDITGDTPVVNPSDDNYVSKTATLNVTDGIVAPGATGSFYLATRAFTAPEGEQLTLTVTANGETVEKVATLSKETTFAAGNINKLNVNVAAAAEQASTWEKVTSLADITAGEYIIANGDYFLPTTTTGSKNAPVPYTLESQGISFVADSFTGIVPDIAKWTFTGTNTAMTITNSGGDYLYGINENNGIRVGTTSDITWAFEVYNDGFAMKNSKGRYCAIYVADGSPQDWRSYTSKNHNNYQINDGILYLYKKGDARSALETPTGVEAVARGNEVLVSWNEVSGAASYTVSFEPATIEPQTIESTGEAYYTQRFTLDYATEYTVSVVANPADTENYKASAPATATFTTGENPNVTYTQIKDLVKGETVAIKDALVVATSTRGPILWDETGAILAYQPSETPAIGSVVTVNATVGEYNKALQLNDATFTVTGTTEVPTQTATEVTAANIDDLMTVESVTVTYVKFTGILNISEPYYNVVFPFETNYQGSLYYPDAEALGLAALNGREVNVEGWFTSITTYSESPKYLNVVATQVSSASEAPYITADETASFVAAGETKTISFLTDNLGSNQVFAEISGDGAGQFSVGQIGAESIPVTAVENTETTAKTATLTLYIAASEGGKHLAEAIVTLTQAGVSSGEGPAIGTVLWSETWTGGTAGETPSKYGQEGTTVYNNAPITYNQTSTNTKLYAEKLAGGTAPELLLSRNNQTWTISGIPFEGVTSAVLTMKANNESRTEITYYLDGTGDGVTAPKGVTATINNTSNAKTVTIEIKNTSSSNVRLDDIELKVTN